MYETLEQADDSSFVGVLQLNYGQGNAFSQCAYLDQCINQEIQQSLNKIHQDEQFAFFSLCMDNDEQKALSNYHSSKFQEIKVGNLSDVNYLGDDKISMINSLVAKSLYSLGDIGISTENIPIISNLITKIDSAISGNIDGNTELIIRITPKINQDCTYWHIDKDFVDISDQQQITKRFVIPLVGNGTFYQEINTTTRNQFFNYSSSLPGYWGHDYDECTGEDAVSQIFSNKSFMITARGYGSVHYLGCNGTMHSEPSTSNSRLILIISEIKR